MADLPRIARQRILVMREQEPETCACVSAIVDMSSSPGLNLRQRIDAAVRDWMTSTPAGAVAWRASSEDFNIGDLMGHVTDLRPYLTTYGVFELGIDNDWLDGSSIGWRYDTILGRPEEPALLPPGDPVYLDNLMFDPDLDEQERQFVMSQTWWLSGAEHKLYASPRIVVSLASVSLPSVQIRFDSDEPVPDNEPLEWVPSVLARYDPRMGFYTA